MTETSSRLDTAGWCAPCYDDGAFTLALTGQRCLVHTGPPRPPGGGPARGPHRSTPKSGRRPRGRGARTPAPPPRPRRRRRDVQRQVLRAMAYGLRRAAVRLQGPSYAPHPGWRNLIAEGWRVLVDQSEAFTRIEDLVDAEDWRTDKRTAWTAILRQMVCVMDWDTGLIAAATAARLAGAGRRSPRTMSRVIAWARHVGLVVVVEQGASARFLGTAHGRTPTYALVSNVPAPVRPVEALTFDDPVDKNDAPPTSSVDHYPLTRERLEPTTPTRAPWPFYLVPNSPVDRTAATKALFRRMSLDQPGVSGGLLWRGRALLRRWWDAGACPAALLWAIDHHPDHPSHPRGDALRGARDPLRVLAHRLAPWQDRLHELPTHLTGHPAAAAAGTRSPIEDRHTADPVAADVRCRPAHRRAPRPSRSR